MNRYFTYIILLIFVFATKNTLAQDNCIVKLNAAEKLFEKGNIEEIPELLSGCVESGFNRENKTKALRLLTLVYLSEDNTLKAEKSFLKLLSNDPEYKINRAIDPVEFIQLYNSFNTAPKFSIGIIAGPTITTPHLIETYSKNSFQEANPKYSNSGMGISMGLKGIYHINNMWDISIEPIFSYLTYSVVEKVTQANTATIIETMNVIEIPILGSYYFYKRNNFDLYAEAGLAYNMLLSSSLDGIITYNEGGISDIDIPSTSTTEIRKNSNLLGVVGVGTRIDLNRSNIQASVRYNAGIINITKTDMRYSDHEGLSSEYQFIDNDVLVNKFSLMISYNIEFYIHNKKPSNRSNYDIIK